VLILDEPTAALDPLGSREVFGAIEQLRRDRRMTIVMVSQDAEHVAAYADRLALLVEGRILSQGPPLTVFADDGLMQEAGLASPQLMQLSGLLRGRFGLTDAFYTLDGAERALRATLEARP